MTTRKDAHELQEAGPIGHIDWEAGRRAFLRTCGFAAAGAAALGVVGAAGEARADKYDVPDADIFNFALNLEYLEAEFYLRATRGAGNGLGDADISGTGKLGGVDGGKRVKFDTPNVRMLAEELAEDELAHVRFLRDALGDHKIARPSINLRESFNTAAAAAGLIEAGGTFDAFANENNFLLAGFLFEDVGVTAYKGAAPLIDDKDLLAAAAGILATEAYHAGALRTMLVDRGLFRKARAISNARDSLDGPNNFDFGIGSKDNVNFIPVDARGLAIGRSSTQVKAIVLLNAERKPGGFFPQGLNG